MSTARISIAKDFSPFPGGRYRKFGPFSGEEFRETKLVPLLRSNDRLVVDLDGVRGAPSSFFDEAFAGLVRCNGFVAAELIKKLEFVSEEDPTQIAEIFGYIKGEH